MKVPDMSILVINAGSSSLKVTVIDPRDGRRQVTALAEQLDTPSARMSIDQEPACALDDPSMGGALRQLASRFDNVVPPLRGVGHRVVHGGERFQNSVRIDRQVIDAIQACARLAPLHNPANLAGIAAVQLLRPDLPQVAVFDTAFHQTMPEMAWRYAVPDAWYLDHGVRRYGFHGTSHRFVSMQAAVKIGRPLSELKMVTAHLGNGCSAAAIDGGRSLDTTMGLTPLEGLVMGTRSGDLDAGILAHVGAATGLDVQALVQVLNRESGLQGLSGLSNDMRTLTTALEQGHAAADLAVTVFCYRLAKAIAGLSVALGRLDALIFTGGIGEHSALVRSRTLGRLGFLGLIEDPQANAMHGSDSGLITNPGASRALVVPTDEELLIARDTAGLITGSGA